MNITWSRQALSELRGIRTYIAKESPGRAQTIVSRIRAASLSLQQFPYQGRRGRLIDTYELVVPRLPYILVYQVIHNTVVIQRVLHGAQRWPR